jgi:TetR/AcrR family transcriptional regulator
MGDSMTDSVPARSRGQKDAEVTREALVAAGIELFAEFGFAGATTEVIARKAGVNKAMINYHFGGKEGLYEAILDRTLGPLAERLAELSRSEFSPEEILPRLLGTLRELHESRPNLSIMLLREIVSGGQHLGDRLLPRFLRIFATVRELVERGIRSGHLRQVDPLMTHLTLMGSVVFFYATAPFRRRLVAEGKVSIPLTPSSEQFMTHLQSLLTHGIVARPDPRPAARES